MARVGSQRHGRGEYSFVALPLEMEGGAVGIFPLINCCEFMIPFFRDPDPLTY